MDSVLKRFYFIRHAESHWNIKKLCQGHRDIGLSEKGVREAEFFAEKFSNFPIEHICTSPLKRALHTAEIIKQYHPKASFSIVQELSERNWGCLEGISSDAMYEIENLEETNPDYKLDSSIESREDLKFRISQGLEIVFQQHHEPFIVSNGRLFVSLCELLEIPVVRQIPNLCLFEITKRSGKWILNEMNL
jgi:broad specificity phosphatase PhoE